MNFEEWLCKQDWPRINSNIGHALKSATNIDEYNSMTEKIGIAIAPKAMNLVCPSTGCNERIPRLTSYLKPLNQSGWCSTCEKSVFWNENKRCWDAKKKYKRRKKKS